MCGRYTLSSSEDEIQLLFDLPERPFVPPRYNIAPTQETAVVRVTAPGGPRRLDLLRWGLIPYWAKEAAIGNRMINARSESVAEKAAFSWSFQKKRCLVAADGFYEWKKEGKVKQPFLIRRQNAKPFAIAGLWSSWYDSEKRQRVDSFTILTTDANDLLRPLHDRMPVILEPESFDLWLDPRVEDEAKLKPLLLPHTVDDYEAFPVTRAVGNPAYEEPDCIVPLVEDSPQNM